MLEGLDLVVVQQRGQVQRDGGGQGRSWPAARRRHAPRPPNSQMTVRSLNSGEKHSPWSTPQMRSSGPSSTWPLLRSVLLARMSNAHMARSWGCRSGRCS